jgi:hypothetical protein
VSEHLSFLVAVVRRQILSVCHDLAERLSPKLRVVIRVKEIVDAVKLQPLQPEEINDFRVVKKHKRQSVVINNARPAFLGHRIRFRVRAKYGGDDTGGSQICTSRIT